MKIQHPLYLKSIDPVVSTRFCHVIAGRQSLKFHSAGTSAWKEPLMNCLQWSSNIFNDLQPSQKLDKHGGLQFLPQSSLNRPQIDSGQLVAQPAVGLCTGKGGALESLEASWPTDLQDLKAITKLSGLHESAWSKGDTPEISLQWGQTIDKPEDLDGFGVQNVPNLETTPYGMMPKGITISTITCSVCIQIWTAMPAAAQSMATYGNHQPRLAQLLC